MTCTMNITALECDAWLCEPEAWEGLELSAKAIEDVTRWIAEPIKPVDSPTFTARDAEAQFFGRGTSNVPTAGSMLSGEQERLLFLRFNYARCRAAMAQDRLQRHGPNRDEARELLRWCRLSLRLRNRIVCANLRLVMKIGTKARRDRDDLSELASEGHLALIRAAEHFDAGRGLKFSTYAWPAIERAIRRRGAVEARYRHRFGVEYDPCCETGDEQSRRTQRHESACAHEVSHIIRDNRANLTPLELAVVERRYGFNGRAPLSLDKIGLDVGRSAQRVTQIQRRAIEKIRGVLHATYLERAEPAFAA